MRNMFRLQTTLLPSTGHGYNADMHETCTHADLQCEKGISCPIASVHARMREAHKHWHNALDNYSSPEDFRISLNSCIQTLRNVTYALQFAKSTVNDFASWYSAWQEHMRSDSTMRAIIEARNIIVKQGDLDTSSKARISLVAGYDDPPSYETDIPPHLDSASIATFLADKTEVDDYLRENGLIKVVRRWACPQFGDSELLSTLAYAYQFLAILVEDAHVQLATIEQKDTSHYEEQINAILHNMPKYLNCMTPESSLRTCWVKLGSGEISIARTEYSPISRTESEEAAKLYGYPDDLIADVKSAKTFRQRCNVAFKMARLILTKDGNHHPIALLDITDKPSIITAVQSINRTDKFILWRHLASLVLKHSCESIIFISEAWSAPADSVAPGKHAVDSPDRIELLGLHGISNSGSSILLNCRIMRVLAGVELGETVCQDNVNLPYASHVVRALKIVQDRTKRLSQNGSNSR